MFLSPKLFALSHPHMTRFLASVFVLSLEVGQRSQEEPGQEAVRAGPKPQEAENPRSTPM